MSYELQTDQVLGGGLDLLSPGELGDQTSAVALHNWRVDQGGQLRSRLGMGAAVFTAGGYHHSLGRVEALTPRRYVGVDTSWYRVGTGAAIGTGFDGQPFGMVSFQGRCWAMNRSQQLKDDGTNTYGWSPLAPTAAPTVAYGGTSSGALNGVYNYYVTFVAGDGAETNPSPVLTTSSLTNDEATVTRPASADPQITGWNVYREGGDFPNQRYKLNASPLAIGGTEFLDNGVDNTGLGGDDLTDNGIANLGVILAINHDPAPAARFVVGPYNGRLFVFGTAANPNRMFWTEADEPQFFPGSATDAGGNWADIGELGEEFIGAAVFPQVLLIIKGKSVWRLIGDVDSGEIERLNVDVGGIGLKAWAVSGATVYFQSQEGIQKTTVSGTGVVSGPLTPIFKDDAVEAYGAVPANPLDPSPVARARATMAVINGRVYFSFASLGGTGFPDSTLVLNEKTGQWMTDSRGFTALLYEGQGGSLLGAIDGSLYPLEQGMNDNDAAIPLVYQSRFRNQGQPNVRKHYANLEIEHRCNGATMKVSVIFDGAGGTLAQVGTFTSGGDRLWAMIALPDFDHGNEPRSIAVRIELQAAGTSYVEILAVVLRWYAVPLDGVVFDSGNFKLADGKVCYLQNLELDLENVGAGTVSYEWRSDLPGNQVQKTAASNVAGAGIGSFRVPLGVKEARWARLIVRCSLPSCRVFGARVEIRPIGLYLAGSGDGYKSPPLDCGSPRLKLVSRMRIASQCDGAVPAVLSSDIPAGDPATQATNVPATIERQWFEKEFPSTTRAKLLRVALTSAAVGRIFAILLRVKGLGESQSGWSWYTVPIPETPDEWQMREIPIS
ncbi:MAG TPA: hypothetical protein VHZ74_10780 [Bryobacteraceae bacterium]|nr:hypothetical protein [Bryobacteraceae bacterium]